MATCCFKNLTKTPSVVFSGGFRFLFPSNTWFLVMFAFAHFGKDACSCTLFFKAANCTVKCFIFTNFNISQLSFPSPHCNLREKTGTKENELPQKYLFDYIFLPEVCQQSLTRYSYPSRSLLTAQISCRPVGENVNAPQPGPQLHRNLLPPYNRRKCQVSQPHL